jgi:HSP20 family protein
MKMTLPARRSVGHVDRWSPLRDFGDLYQELDRFMRTAWEDDDGSMWTPAADVFETDDAYLVEIDVPGVRHEDIDVEMHGNELVVTGEIKQRERKGLLRRRTRKAGEFEYRVTLPGDLHEDGIDATIADGVLTIRIPKADHARATKIKVNEQR